MAWTLRFSVCMALFIIPGLCACDLPLKSLTSFIPNGHLCVKNEMLHMKCNLRREPQKRMVMTSNESEQSSRRNILGHVFSLLAGIVTKPNKSMAAPLVGSKQDSRYLWDIYENKLKSAKYIDLTYAFAPVQPVWPGFGETKFRPAVAAKPIEGFIKQGEAFSYEKQGFVATSYELSTDQYGTQLDPPAHWNPLGATISDLPATFTLRPLVVINIADKVKTNESYHLQIPDVLAWEAEHGRIPEGSVVMVRSDWYKKWGDRERFASKPFPGVSLSALQLLHTDRRILFHGHEPLDTDTTPTLEGEAWLLRNNYAQAEAVANLDLCPPAGALISIGFAKPLGGSGGYARFVAIAPADWPHGASVLDQPGAPLPVQPGPLRRGADGVLRPQRP